MRDLLLAGDFGRDTSWPPIRSPQPDRLPSAPASRPPRVASALKFGGPPTQNIRAACASCLHHFGTTSFGEMLAIPWVEKSNFGEFLYAARCFSKYSSMEQMTLAGLPAQTVLGGSVFETTELAPTMVRGPISTPARNHGASADVTRRMNGHASHSCRIQELVHLRIMRKDDAAIAETTVIADTNQVAVG